MLHTPAPHSDDRLREFEAAHQDAADHADNHPGPLREGALRYYSGEPFGDETDGRGARVQTEQRDTVLAVPPHLRQVFASDASRVFDFVPRRPRGVEAADEQTNHTNHTATKKSGGYRLVHDLLKDALMAADFARTMKSNVPDASLLANSQAVQIYGGERSGNRRHDRLAVDLAGN